MIYFIKLLVLQWEPPLQLPAANAFMLRHEKNIVNQYSQYLQLYKRFIDDIIVVWTGPRDLLLEFINTLNTKDDRIKITFDISDSSIPFLDLLLFKDREKNTIQFCTFQKPLIMNKYFVYPHSSRLTPPVIKRAFIKGVLMRYARNSWSFTTFANLLETVQITRLSPPFFASAVSRNTLTAVNGSKTANVLSMVKLLYLLHTTAAISISRGFNIQKYLPEVKCIISYKSTKTLASLCK